MPADNSQHLDLISHPRTIVVDFKKNKNDTDSGKSLGFPAMASFAILMNAQPGVVSVIDGKQVLHNHGNIIRELTDEEYRHALAVEARQLIGHYLAFFGVGAAILYPNRDDENNL